MAALSLKLAEIDSALAAGADEIDFVVDRSAFLTGDDARAGAEITAARRSCAGATLKVILETSELGSYATVRRAAEVALAAGADFLKTSTGKGLGGATPALALLLAQVLRAHARATAQRAGLKLSGGVRTARSAFMDISPSSGRRWVVHGCDWICCASARQVCSTISCAWARRGAAPGTGRVRMETLLAHPDAPSPLPYAPAPESRDAVKLRERYGLFVGGTCTAAQNEALSVTLDAATEAQLAEVETADAGYVDRSVSAARRAYDKYWRKLRPAERAKYLYRIARAISERAGEGALIETLDAGKPIRETRTFDVPAAQASIFYPRGLGGQTRVGGAQFGTSPAARRSRRDRLGHVSAAQCVLPDHPGAGMRKYRRLQTRAHDAAVCPLARIRRGRSRRSARLAEHRHRR